MTIELFITIIIAIVGWIWAIAQFCYKRKWQKKDELASRRYEAYSRYMRKCEEINENMRKDPQSILDKALEHFTTILISDSQNDINNTITNFNQQLFDYIKQASAPLYIINQEINSLLLIASADLIIKLKEQKDLITDFQNEIQKCLNSINIKDINSFQNLNTMGQEARWQRFISLNNEIITLMRKEIGVEK